MNRIGILLGLLFLCALMPRSEGFKNVTITAQSKLETITQKVLPKNAVCIRNTQCLSGKCIGTENESLFGYCE